MSDFLIDPEDEADIQASVARRDPLGDDRAWFGLDTFGEIPKGIGRAFSTIPLMGDQMAREAPVRPGLGELAVLKQSRDEDIPVSEIVQRRINEIDRKTQADFATFKGLGADPQTSSYSAQIVNALTDYGARAIVGSVAGGVPGSMLAVGATDYAPVVLDMEESGVNTEVAQQMGREQATMMGVMAAAPAAVPGRLLTRVLSGAAINIGLGGFQRGRAAQVLNENGYGDVAERYKILDAQSVIIDGLLGAGFGALHSPGTPRVEVPPEALDAAMVAQDAQRRDTRSPFGLPANNEADRQIAAADARAMEQIANGEPIDVADIFDAGRPVTLDEFDAMQAPYEAPEEIVQSFLTWQKSGKPEAPMTLMEFVKSMGGLKTKVFSEGEMKREVNAGEIESLGRYPGLVNNRKGMHPDDMARAAWEAGYMGDGADTWDIDDLFRLLREETVGNKIYPSEDTDTALARGDYDQATREAARLGIRKNTPEARVRELLAQSDYAERRGSRRAEYADIDPDADLRAELETIFAEVRDDMAAMLGEETPPDFMASRGATVFNSPTKLRDFLIERATGMTDADIAAEYDINANTVSSHVSRFRDRVDQRIARGDTLDQIAEEMRLTVDVLEKAMELKPTRKPEARDVVLRLAMKGLDNGQIAERMRGMGFERTTKDSVKVMRSNLKKAGHEFPKAGAGDFMASRGDRQKTFLGVYSKMRETMPDIERKQGNVQAWANEFQKRGIDAESIDYTLKRRADPKATLTRDDVMRLIATGIDVMRTDFAPPKSDPYAAQRFYENIASGAMNLFPYRSPFKKVGYLIADIANARHDAIGRKLDNMDLAQYELNNAQYENYALGGGTDYRESVYSLPGGEAGAYRNHWDDVENNVFHARSSRFGIGRVVQELQSFIHQAGRDKGYDVPLKPAEQATFDALLERLKNINDRLKIAWDNIRDYGVEAGPWRNRTKEQHERSRDLDRKRDELVDQKIELQREIETIDPSNKVYDAPFKKNWQEKLVALEIYRAAEEGEKGIWFTGPEVQNGIVLEEDAISKGQKLNYGEKIPSIVAKAAEVAGAKVKTKTIEVKETGGGNPNAKKRIKVYGFELTSKVREAIVGDGVPMFSRGAFGEGTSAAKLETTMRQAFGASTDRLFNSGKVEVLDSVAELNAAVGLDLPKDTKAGHVAGKTYVVAQNVSPSEARGILLHEVGVHNGMAKMLGDAGMARLKVQIDALLASNHPAVMEARALAEAFALKPEHVEEETIAYLVEHHSDMPVIRRLLAQIRQWLWRTFPDLVDLTPDDLAMMAVASLRRVATEEMRTLPDVPKGFMTSAKAAGYVGDNAGEAIEWLRAKAHGLDMSPGARKDRAEAAGFDITKVLYHGTAAGDFSEFDPYGSGNYGLMGQGVYLTDNPEVASSYTKKGAAKRQRRGDPVEPFVYPVFARVKNPIDMDAPADLAKWKTALDEADIDIDTITPGTNEEMYRALEEFVESERLEMYEGAERIQDVLRSMGHDGIIHIGGGRVDADGIKHQVTVVFDPENIRSVNAAFDPEYTQYGNMLASFGGALATREGRARWANGKEVKRAQYGNIVDYTFNSPGGEIEVSFTKNANGAYGVVWDWAKNVQEDNQFAQASFGDKPFQSLGQIISVVERFLADEKPAGIHFAGLSNAHTKLYSRMVMAVLPDGWKAWDVSGEQNRAHEFAIVPKDTKVKEMFPQATPLEGVLTTADISAKADRAKDFGVRAYLEWFRDSGGDEMRASRGKKKDTDMNDPVKAAIADDPAMKIPTERGELAPVNEALMKADELFANAKELSKGFEAAGACAARHAASTVTQAELRTAELVGGFAWGATVAGAAANVIAPAAMQFNENERQTQLQARIEAGQQAIAEERAQYIKENPVTSIPMGRSIENTVMHAAERTGVPEGFLSALVRKESAGDPNAKASTSSATGATQFVDGTWRQELIRVGSKLGFKGDPYSDEALELRKDPRWAIMVGAEFAKANAQDLKSALGRDPTHGEVYLAHFMGLKGAIDLINAAAQGAPNAADLFPEAAAANQNVFHGSAKDVLKRQTKGFSNEPFMVNS